jgi:CBS domain containing-hemolysin-like protein
VSGSDFLLILANVGLLLILTYLAIAETALNRISRVKAESIADQRGTRSARSLARLAAHPERWVNALLVTITTLQVFQSMLTAQIFDRFDVPAGFWVGLALNVVILLVLCEAMPKTWAVLSSERAALMTARVTEILAQFPPLRLASRGVIGLTNVLLPGKGLKEGPFVSEQELLGIVGAAADDEVIEDEERELIESIIEFGDTVAREVMVPRPDMLIVENDATVTAALDMAIANGVSRLPVFDSDGDDIVGLAYTKDLIRSEREGRGDQPVLDLARPVHFVPENKPVRKLMREMQNGKFHLAIVADEYGGIAGLVTLEDCLEELVGEIVDEYDVEEAAIVRQPNGDYIVDGSTPVGDLSDMLDLDLPDDDWDSVGGFVFGTLGHVPALDESIVHEGWRFSVADLDGRRIMSVRISSVPDDESHQSGATIHRSSETELHGDGDDRARARTRSVSNGSA